MTEPQNLLYCLIGVLIGMVIGVLPGLGPAATMAILLPLVITVDPISAIIMLAGIYYGAQYGGTITSVLLRLPGEASSVVTVFDGYALAKQGKAGTALGIAAIGSFVGATISIIVLSLTAPLVAGWALDFGPPEYAALALLGVLLIATIGTGHPVKAMIAAMIGLLLATVGRDAFTNAAALHLRQPAARLDGLDFVVVAMGLFGVGEILYNLEERYGKPHVPAKIANIWPSRKDLRQSSGAIGRGSVIGFFLGVLPGGGAVMSSLAAYAVEKRVAKTPERVRARRRRGRRRARDRQQRRSNVVVHPAADPRHPGQRVDGDAVRRASGPRHHARARSCVEERPDLFWGVVNSMYIGNILLLILSIPLVGIFVRILRVRPAILAPITALITILGAYTINNSVFDIFVMIAFGIIGYLMKKTGFEPGPMVLAFVLGAILEDSVRRSLLIFDGDPTGFVTRPISGTILALFLLVVLSPAIKVLLDRRRATSPEPPPSSRAGRPPRGKASDDHPDRLRPNARRRGRPRRRAGRGRRARATTW